MTAYNFRPAFAPLIASGAKLLTLRRDRTPPARHARVGETIGLWIGMRTPQATLITRAECMLRCTLTFDAGGVREIAELRESGSFSIPHEKLLTVIHSASENAIAKLDGFRSWAEAWAWHDQNRSAGERLAQTLTRELVAWRPLNETRAAQLAA